MKQFAGKPVVDVRFGDSGPHTFFLDSGASGSVCDLTFLDEIGLPRGTPMQVQGGAGGDPLDGFHVDIPVLHVGPTTWTDVGMIAFDRSHIPYEDGAPRGVLSTAVFENHTLTFDYPGGSLEVEEGSLPPGDGLEVFEYAADPNDPYPPLPTLPVRFGDLEIVSHIDTGSMSYLGLPLDLAEKVELASDLEVIGRAVTVSSVQEVYGARPGAPIRIGRHEIDVPRVNFLPGLRTGNVGSRVLEKYLLSIDHTNSRIALRERP
jgi:hypothetical protein